MANEKFSKMEGANRRRWLVPHRFVIKPFPHHPFTFDTGPSTFALFVGGGILSRFSERIERGRCSSSQYWWEREKGEGNGSMPAGRCRLNEGNMCGKWMKLANYYYYLCWLKWNINVQKLDIIAKEWINHFVESYAKR